MKTLPTYLLIPAILLLNSLAATAQISEFSTRISNVHVNNIVQDKDGYIWFATANGLNRFNGTNYTVFHSTLSEGGLNNDNVFDIAFDSEGRLWYGSECGMGYWQGGRFYTFNDAVYNPVNRILELEPGYIVAMGRLGFIKFDANRLGRVEKGYYAAGVNSLENILVSDRHDVWFTRSINDSTYLDILDSNLEPIKEFALGKGVAVHCLSCCPSNTVWLSTSEGLRCYDTRDYQEIHTLHTGIKDFADKSKIHFILPYSQGRILFGLAGRGMYLYNPGTGQSQRIIFESTLSMNEYACFVDKDYNIWLSDKTNEVRFISSDKPYTNIFNSYKGHSVDPKFLYFDRNGRLLVLNGGRILTLDPDTGDILDNGREDKDFSYMYIDSQDLVWVITDHNKAEAYRQTANGLVLERRSVFSRGISSLAEMPDHRIVVPVLYDLEVLQPDGRIEGFGEDNDFSYTHVATAPGSRRVFLFTVDDGVYEIQENRSLARIGNENIPNVCSALVARDGTIWLGTYLNGLVHVEPATGRTETYGRASGLINGNVRAILEDKDGNIWFSTPSHITKYDISRRVFSVIHDDQFNTGMSYNLGCATVGPDGTLFFGGTGGITVIDPAIKIQDNVEIPLSLEYVAVNGEELPEWPSRLKLSHDKNALEFRFAGLDFRSGALLNYSYLLEGYEDNWNFTSSNDILASYSHLPAGKYTFRARVRNQDGRWSESTISLPIIIRPSLWSSIWAKIFYALLGLAFIAILIRLLARWRLHQERMALDQEHIDMVTNISHEFRSPLSLIYGPLKELSESPNLNERDHGLVTLMKRNAERLRMLSEQILSTSKGESREERLAVSEGNLSDLVNSVVDNFRFAILEKNLELETKIPDGITGFFDGEKVEKILSNLISNAIKYTPEGGCLKVSFCATSQDAQVYVYDNGEGIPEDKRDKLFERYERFGAEKSKPGIRGTGIGLNYSHHLTRLHKGDLVYRPNDPRGSIFRLDIPISRNSYAGEDFATSNYFVIPERSELPVRPSTDESQEKNGTLLVVEDNPDIRTYLSSLFSDRYRVMIASDGMEAEENLKVAVPDLVISDVMMPRKNGYILCSEIKNSPERGHIPVILLTAKADAQSSIEGLHCGADAYIPKPFDPNFLKATVEGQIANRKRVQEHILNLTSTSIRQEEPDTDVLKALDREFLDKIHKIMDTHLEEENFNVNDITREIGMSYSSLYTKVKTLTGKTPLDFLNTYRMNIAMELLKGGRYTVNEVSYRVGASSPSNFSRNFKKQFGIPPSTVK
ncbi:MAG: response regulator [Bacteroidota bacterium]|nr:response regulator [Bacteroidota bacterium]